LLANEDKAIRLGHPSYVWRFGQDRRLDMILAFATLEGRAVLDVGCGIGAYVRKMTPFSRMACGVDLDEDKIRQAHQTLPNVAVSKAEHLPFPGASFDVVLLHEIIEHVGDDRLTLRDACRVLTHGGRLVIFAPNRLYPFETHGAYWGGRYHFGNIPLVNYLPDRWRNKLCPHVRAYTIAGIRALYQDLPLRLVEHTQIYPGYDKIAARLPFAAGLLRRVTYFLEHTPLRLFGLSHLVVLEKL
jgi:SAM-dependent methyltransferase